MTGPAGRLASALALGALVVGAGACGSSSRPRPPAAHIVRVAASGCSLADEVATGVVVADGLVLTAAHGLRGAREVRVDDRPARVVRLDRRTDAAIVAVPGLDGAVVVAPAAGRGAVSVGLRGGAQPAEVRRVITADVDEPADSTAYRREALELDAAIAPGDSGAPVLDRDGRLVGMVFATSRGTDRTAYAVAASELRPLLAGATATDPTVDLGTCH
jgi:S1-C subfamily serine protease